MMLTSDKSTTIVVQSAVIVVSICTAGMNARYGYTQGAHEIEKWMFVAVALCFDVLKFMGLRYVATAFLKKYWVKGTLGFMAWLIVSIYGLNSALGFAMATRSHMQAEQAFEASKHTSVDAAYKNKFDHLEKLQSDLKEYTKNPRYARTTACSVPNERMTNESKFFCQVYWRKEAEIAEAKKEVAAAEEKMKQEKGDKKFVADADPLMSMYAKLGAWKLDEVTMTWALVFAFMMEVVSSVGNYAFSPSRKVPVRKEEAPVEEVPVIEKKRRGRPPGSKNKPKLVVVN